MVGGKPKHNIDTKTFYIVIMLFVLKYYLVEGEGVGTDIDLDLTFGREEVGEVHWEGEAAAFSEAWVEEGVGQKRHQTS